MEPPPDPSPPLDPEPPPPLASWPQWHQWPPPELPSWVLVMLIPGTLLIFLAVQGGLQLLNLGMALWFTEVFVFLALPWLLARFRQERPVVALRAHWPGWAPLAWGLALGAVNYFGAVVPLQFLSQQLFPESWVNLFDMSRLFERQDPLDMALLLAAVSVAAPVCEEVFFRGFLQERLSRVTGDPWRVAVFVAVVFSAFHLDPVGFLARFELGLLFGLLYLKTGSLWPSVMAHAANNITSTALFLWAKGQEGSDEEPEGWTVLLLASVGLTILAALLRFALRTRVRPAPPPEQRPLTPHTLWPWPVAAFLGIGALLAVDFQGVQLNLIDARVNVPSEKQGADVHEEKLRDELFQLRSRARKGHASLDEYEEKRREVADLLRLKED